MNGLSNSDARHSDTAAADHNKDSFKFLSLNFIYHKDPLGKKLSG